jgi:predicted lipase
MKQNKQMYEAPKVELIEMQAQGVLCASAEKTGFTGTGLQIDDQYTYGAWTMP